MRFLLFVCLLAVTKDTMENINDLLVDISEQCKNKYSTSVHLPFGSGSTDSRVILLRTISSLMKSCSLLVVGPHHDSSCKNKCITVFVIEFYSYLNNTAACSAIEGDITIQKEKNQHIKICKDINKKSKNLTDYQMNTYLIFGKSFLLDINITSYSGSIKMTATSAKYLGNYDNCTKEEINCMLDDKIFCINKLLECDGNLNCGTPKLYDEYCTNLDVQDNMLFTIIYGIFLITVLMFFCAQMLRICVPTIAENFFLFNESKEFTFVLTSQSLPPLEEVEEEQQERYMMIETHLE